MGGAGDARPLPLALTMGDPAGIGLDITLAAWWSRARHTLPACVFYGDPDALGSRARALGLDVPIEIVADAAGASKVFTDALPVVSIKLAVAAVPGKPEPQNAPAILASIEQATADTIGRRTGALVTNPIAKSVLIRQGFPHPGHTEFLGELASRHYPGQTFHPVMMLAAAGILRVVPLTIHIPLERVADTISRELIRDTVLIVHAALVRDFGIASPRIAIAGLNPHAGENGTIGTEERDFIAPAIAGLRERGLAVTGPHSADTLFHATARATYDAVIAMYHDQALIPIKTLAFDEGVNVTLGLPFVRTSPDHGTAFDIAGTGRARADSLIQALLLAREMAARRSRVPV